MNLDTGFQIATGSLSEVLRIIDEFRDGIERESRQIMKQYILKVSPSDYGAGFRAWRDQRSKTVLRGIRDHEVDTQFQITVFPDGDRFLGIAFTERHKWFKAWLQQPCVSEFGFWDATDDTPDGVTYEDFVKRREVWDRVLGNGIPAMNGFTIDITDPNGPQLWKLHQEEQEVEAAAQGPSP